jgi:hypothetical protein
VISTTIIILTIFGIMGQYIIADEITPIPKIIAPIVEMTFTKSNGFLFFLGFLRIGFFGTGFCFFCPGFGFCFFCSCFSCFGSVFLFCFYSRPYSSNIFIA